MFTDLLDKLTREYEGQELYVPDALYDMVKGWLCAKHGKDPRRVDTFKYKGKTVVPYNEQRVLEAYQSCPISIPERILEQTYIIECSIPTHQPQEEDATPEPEPEPIQEQQTEEPQEAPRLHLWGIGG